MHTLFNRWPNAGGRLPTVSPVTLAGRCQAGQGAWCHRWAPVTGTGGKKKKPTKKNPTKKTIPPTPGASTQQLQRQIPMETAKKPTQPWPIWTACFGSGGGKKNKNKYRRAICRFIYQRKLGTFGRSRVLEGQARCKGPDSTQSTCKIPLPEVL